jgi:ribosomal protein L7/L12
MRDKGIAERFWWLRSIEVPKKSRQEADRRVGELLFGLLDQPNRAEVETLVEQGRFVFAVRRVRELTGMSLIDAKRAVESVNRKRLS